MRKIVTIIIPVYNVESFIERCARSLYEQSYPYIEYIWVDDATPDKSIELLRRITQEYPSRESQVQIIHHDKNRGLPSARNTGLAAARGEYIFHCDSDDWVEKDMIRQYVRKAEETDADIIYSEWFLTFSKRERYMSQPSCDTVHKCIDAMLSGSMRFNVWNKFVRHSLYTDSGILFPDGYAMGEDMTMIKLFACAGKVAFLDKAFYHYMQTNPFAFTKVFSNEHWRQLFRNVEDIHLFIRQKYGDQFSDQLQFFSLNVKLPLLISADRSSYEQWITTFADSNIFISRNKSQSARTRFLQLQALGRRFFLVRIHYYFVTKLVYGIIYRQ